MIHLILMNASYFGNLISLGTTGCDCFIYFSYYKFRFDQINDQIKASILKGKWKLILYRKEKLFLNFINEHNLLALEIHKVNF